MKVLWVGDAACSTGFARCTHAAVDALHEAGHDVSVLGLNYRGDPHGYPYDIYPCIQPFDEGRDAMGITRLPVLASRLRPDVIVLLNDPWNVPEYVDYWGKFVDTVRTKGATELADALDSIKWIGWLAVDAENQDGAQLSGLDHVVVWTQFAAKEFARGGYMGNPSIVPLGVDHSLFYERDRDEARAAVCPAGLPSGAFIVGAVGRNQPRKRIDLAIRYFARFLEETRSEDAYLYLHVAPTGDRECDINRLCRYYRIQTDRVIVARPSIGYGSPDEMMPLVYSAFDVLLTVSQGEGWGLPVLEAMACGTPCIVPDWAALGDWPGNAVVKVPCSGVGLNAPLNGRAYTVGGIPDEAATVAALIDLYTTRHESRAGGWADYRARGVARSLGYSWKRTGEMMRDVVESVAQEEAPVHA